MHSLIIHFSPRFSLPCLCLSDFDRPLSCLFDTSSLSLSFSLSLDVLLFQAMTPPRDTCFSDLLLTAESVDNGGVRAAHSGVDIVVRSAYRRKIIERQEGLSNEERRYPSLND